MSKSLSTPQSFFFFRDPDCLPGKQKRLSGERTGKRFPAYSEKQTPANAGVCFFIR
jgi:hypothetical protein